MCRRSIYHAKILILDPNGLMNKKNKGLTIVRIKERMKQLKLENKPIAELNKDDIENIKNNKFAITRKNTILKDDIKKKITLTFKNKQRLKSQKSDNLQNFKDICKTLNISEALEEESQSVSQFSFSDEAGEISRQIIDDLPPLEIQPEDQEISNLTNNFNKLMIYRKGRR